MSTDRITTEQAQSQICAILARVEPDQDFVLHAQRKAIADAIVARRAEYIDAVVSMENAGENALYERGVAFGMDQARIIALNTKATR